MNQNEKINREQPQMYVASDLTRLLTARTSPPVEKPVRLNEPVLAIIKHWATKSQYYAILMAVDEDDCDWRVVDAGAFSDELAHDYNVISWIMLPPI